MSSNQRRRERRSLSKLAGFFGLLGLVLAACQMPGLPELDPATAQLHKFGSCQDLQDHLQREAISTAEIITSSGSNYEPFGFVGSSFTSESPSSSSNSSYSTLTVSTTNNQEAGVHEADLFQVDDTHAFALSGDRIVIIEALASGTAAAAFSIDGAQIVATIDVEGTPLEMFLVGNRLVVLSRVTHNQAVYAYGAGAPDREASAALVKALVYDVSNRSNPSLVREVLTEGEYMAARRVNNQVYLVSRAMLGGPEPDDTVAMSNWANTIERATLDEWMPYHFNTVYDTDMPTRSFERSDCGNAWGSTNQSGDDVLGIFSFDISNDTSEVRTTTIVGDGSIVYASAESVVVALTNYSEATYADSSTEEVASTFLHRFELNGDSQATYQASGVVHGWILNQFSLSEYQGYLRIATQRYPDDDWANESMIFTIRVDQTATAVPMMTTAATESVEYLEVAGELLEIAWGEDLYAARFNDEIGYLVTFQATDPLWIVDLSNPAEPRMRGDLQVPGFSTYLHPIAGDRLLAIGQNQDGVGLEPYGIKLSLFDVSNLDWPDVIDERSEGGVGSDSEALTEHRAFRYLESERILAVPMVHRNAQGLFLYRVSDSGFDALGAIDHDAMVSGTIASTDIRRSYQIGDYLYAYSEAAVSITDLSSFQTPIIVDLSD